AHSLGTGDGTSTGPGFGSGSVGNGSTNTAEIRAPLTRPSYARTPLPEYPRVARNNRWEGVVVLRVEVLQDGRVGRVELAQSSGHDILDESAIKAVHHWRFHPAKYGDMPIACFIDVPVRFKLDLASL
ncbi:MAG: energy transducer TonB, partial [Verrucomicrobiae bacterium]|nr:energy transducer TonB [Verrucomicrobiae bacterium]